eukprot:FR740105.1.p1 GENE.FR740105.1~~FR740105.1.p1  ORF type:complete len:135 (+),score=13.27 FR740105.1:82-486(+)
MTFMTTFLYAQLPIPVFFLFALNAPVVLIQKAGVTFLNVLYHPVVSGFSIIGLACGFASAMFLFQVYLTSHLSATESACRQDPDCDHQSIRCSRWREERNFWIAAFALALWVMTYKAKTLLVEIHALKRERRQA